LTTIASKRFGAFLAFFTLIIFSGLGIAHAETPEIVPGPYKHGSDSSPIDGVPKGKVTEHELLESSVFPGTKRRYSVYVPAQYDGSKPAALMVFQDGHAYVGPGGDFRATIVMDNLIHRGEMPITIGVFIDPGTKDALPEKRGWNPRPTNRAVEYDTVSDDYARFLLDDVLPQVTKEFRITDNPELRAICGMSSGGICAFSVAWFRPDSFRKVISHIGSFVDIRGGHVYPALVRKGDQKPLRVFLQDGANDLDNQHGNWPLANQQMANSLAYRKYDYKFVYGDGEHNGVHGGVIFPDTLRWLWRDWVQQNP
jgi:enterochelin esterase family protein